MKEKTKSRLWDYISTVLIIINGVICIIFHEDIYDWLPDICAIVLLIKGIVKLIEGIKEDHHKDLHGKKFERAIVIIAFALVILIKQNDAFLVVVIFWGLSGLNKSANSLNEGLYKIHKKEGGFLAIIKAIVEFILSILLIFDPLGKALEHIVILGVELIFEGIFEVIKIYNGEEEIID